MSYTLPPNVSAYRDRHGKTRYRFRKHGMPSRELPGEPGHPSFAIALAAALAGHPRQQRVGIMARRSRIESHCIAGIKRAARRAAEQGCAFGLTADHIRTLLEAQAWKCAITGLDFDLHRGPNGRAQPFSPSIDRMRPSDGYLPGNVRIVCNIVNFAMNDWGLEPLLRVADALSTRGKIREQAGGSPHAATQNQQ